jgi:hypothetical protein
MGPQGSHSTVYTGLGPFKSESEKSFGLELAACCAGVLGMLADYFIG